MRDLHRLPVYICRLLFEDLWKWLGAGSMSLAQFLFPSDMVRNMAISAFCLILLDTVTGTVAAWQTHVAVTSARFGRVLVKVLGYGSVICVSAIVSKFASSIGDLTSISVAAILTLVILTESLSVLENVRKMGVPLPFGLEKLIVGKIDKIEGRYTADLPAEQEPANRK